MNMQWERYKWLELIPRSVPPPQSPHFGWLWGSVQRNRVHRSLQRLTFAEAMQHLEACWIIDVEISAPQSQSSESTSSNPNIFPNPRFEDLKPRAEDSDILPPPNSDRPPWDYGF